MHEAASETSQVLGEALPIAPVEMCSFDYAIVRVVPRVERGEFVNVGAIVFCSQRGFLKSLVEIDEARLQVLEVLAPDADLELIREHLSLIERVCAGGRIAGRLGEMRQRERFHWLVAPRSTMIQLSPVHCGLCAADVSLEQVLEGLMQSMVRTK